MNNILTSFISDPSIQQPFTGRSLTFLQNASKEIDKMICEGIIGDTLAALAVTRGVVVSGCEFNGSGNTIFYGLIYYNGEPYYFPGASGLLAYVQTAVVVLDETNDATADPLVFSDNVSRNVHKVRRLKVVDQAAGSGLWDLSAMWRMIKPTRLAPGGSATAGAALSAVAGCSFVTPARVTQLRIRAYGFIQFTGAAGPIGYEGGDVWIRNATTATNLAASVARTYEAAGTIHYIPFSMEYIYKDCPASQTINLSCQRNGANNATIWEPVLIYEEVPKL